MMPSRRKVKRQDSEIHFVPETECSIFCELLFRSDPKEIRHLKSIFSRYYQFRDWYFYPGPCYMFQESSYLFNSYQTLRRGVAQILYAENVDNMQQVLALQWRAQSPAPSQATPLHVFNPKDSWGSTRKRDHSEGYKEMAVFRVTIKIHRWVWILLPHCH